MAASLPPDGRFEDEPKGWRQWLFDAMRDHFDSTANAAGMEQQDFRIGGKRVRVCFAGESLLRTLPRAIEHLRATSDEVPELTILAWDSSPVKASSFLLKAYLAAVTHDWWDFVNPRGQLLDFHEPPFMAAYHPGSQVLSLLDLHSNIGLYWHRAEHPLPYYEAGSPLRTMLHWWFRDRQMQFVHAAAVSIANRGVLLAGKGGSGKSTTALACLNAGFDYLGDDYCMVARHPSPTVYSLYNTCKLVGDNDLEKFPGLASLVWNQERSGDDKATVFLRDHCPERLGKSAELQAILLPCVTGGLATSIRPASRMEALMALAPTTIAQLPSSDAQDLRFMKELVHSLPAYSLQLGTNLAQIPIAIKALIQGANPGANAGGPVCASLCSVSLSPLKIRLRTFRAPCAVFSAKTIRIWKSGWSTMALKMRRAKSSPLTETLSIAFSRKREALPRLRNAALREAQGSIFAFLDADDLWAPGHLRRMVHLLEMNPAAGLAQGWIRNWRSGPDVPVSYCSHPYNFSILCSTVFRRSAVDQIGLFDESLRFGEDSDLFIRAWEQHIPKCVDVAVSLHYHRHGSNMTTDKNLQQLGVVQVYQRRLDRIRKGMLDQDAIRGVGLREYLGEPPAAYDDGRYEPVGDEILGYLK